MFKNKDERIEDFKHLCRVYAYFDDEKLAKNLDDIGFFDAPASTKYHGAHPGGLYDHSRAVCARLIELTRLNSLRWQREESPFIIGMFHDLCKCDQYIASSEENGEITYTYNTNTPLKGHAPKSIMVATQITSLTEEEVLCIRFHMGAYETDDWDGFDKAIRKYQNVLWTHLADMLASKVDDI